MNISSVILRARPAQLAGVRTALTALHGVEIHADGNDGRLVLTIEEAQGCTTPDVFRRLQEIDGVLSTSLIYQYCDDEITQESNP